MRLLILGASGGVGRWVTRLASQRGHALTAVVRAETPFDADGVSVERGDVAEPSVIRRVVPGHDAVISCLGLRRTSKNPFARLLSPPDLTERVTRHVVAAMRDAGVRRIMAVSAAGVGDSFPLLTWPVKQVVTSGNVAVAYRDLECMEDALETSGLDWLAVRPVTLMDGKPTGRADVVARYGLFSIIRRSDVASWMLDTFERSGDFAERRLMLASS